MKNLTPMQAAYWTGRQTKGFLGNVAPHLYVEFECGNIDPERLGAAIRKLYEIHGMLRMHISVDGMQSIGKNKESVAFEVEDLRCKIPEKLGPHLSAKRRAWTNSSRDLMQGQPAAFGLSLLPDGQTRLHVDTDMTAIDPPSFCVLMEDLARFYEAPDERHKGPQSGYFEWLERKNADPDLAERYAVDKRWWQKNVDKIAPPPKLKYNHGARFVESGRLAASLGPAERQSLERAARGLRITTSSLLLGLFAAVIGQTAQSDHFRLNVPMFWRPPYTRDTERLVGDFSNVVILSVEPKADDTLKAVCEQVAGRMTDLLAHSAYPGVNVMRDLSRARKAMEIAPVVFTSGVDVPGGRLFSSRVSRVFGPMTWAISQGPQVALDAQVAAVDDGILINWDIRYDALPRDWVATAFEAFVSLLREVAEDPDRLDDVFVPAGPKGRCGGTAEGYTDQMLRALLERQSGGADVVGGNRISDLDLGNDDLAAVLAFINTYIPASGLVLSDIGRETTATELAAVILNRSSGASETVGRAYLEATGAINAAPVVATPSHSACREHLPETP
ncbi:condensation domain-containing protein [Roseibium sp. RKSG952]|uniref:condensation domain-containing protein n=1 Tax=Roseibium sp. RKSG952 TaxID=2529384 RepID=UPI0012BC3C2E|nr:condensation domain-containing protein [Roseibium sp. RKSG952]MTH96589.1 hypothetical protein [Roseibium sp. RKSG952]